MGCWSSLFSTLARRRRRVGKIWSTLVPNGKFKFWLSYDLSISSRPSPRLPQLEEVLVLGLSCISCSCLA
ncbi:OLC1v1031861C1 [Oldenlandia corymbosa var. corymbosa]|uniref:OLC1v1031861C1 n=1 Tax=Oldenlandia corymbosa var. corymbosa TaxID=529605 RepID=A0AAV1CL36_OLDCO|nr:OLC1v1031861C1 [Oldenlandia corymbosa var. corymbosa]